MVSNKQLLELEEQYKEIKELEQIMNQRVSAINRYYSNILTREYAKRKEEKEGDALPTKTVNKGSVKKTVLKKPNGAKSKRKSTK